MWLKVAIANWQFLRQILREMQRLSRLELFATVPGPKRRKRPFQKVLGTKPQQCSRSAAVSAAHPVQTGRRRAFSTAQNFP